jgi:hypothetical protein
VSVTLAGALFCDLLLAPVMIRWLIRDKSVEQPLPSRPGSQDIYVRDTLPGEITSASA